MALASEKNASADEDSHEGSRTQDQKDRENSSTTPEDQEKSCNEKNASADEDSRECSRKCDGENTPATPEKESCNEKNASADDDSHGSWEKRRSSNAESVAVEGAEKQQATALDEAASLEKLDSKVINVNAEDDDPFKHLPDHEKQILKRQTDVPEVEIGFFTLYRYATKADMAILAISAVSAIAAGAALPLMTVSAT